ncbi:MAG: EAL domain-containing protein [Rhizobiaceae bacterium]
MQILKSGKSSEVDLHQEISLDEKLQAKLLIARLRSTSKLTPMIVLVNIIIAGIFLWMYKDSGHVHSKLIWTISLLGMVSYRLFFWWKNFKRRKQHLSGGMVEKDENIKSAFYTLHVMAFVYGLIWGSAAIIFGTTGAADLKTPLAVGLTAILISGGTGLAVIPTAIIVYLIPMLIGCVLAIQFQPPTDGSNFMLLLLAFIASAVIMGNIFYAKMFTAFKLKSENDKEQNAVAAIVLQELQEASSNWLWEINALGMLVRFPEQMLPENTNIKSIKLVDYLSRISTIKGTQMEELETAINENRKFQDILLCTNWGAGETWLRLSGHPVLDDDENVIGFVGTGVDVTAEKLAEDRINTLAHSDNLTGLMNRSAFLDRLEKSVANMERYGRPFTVLYLDLDDFKLVNDTRGHLVGDRLLAEVSERIEDEVREGDCLARLAGDEFVILMESQGDAGAAARLAARLIGEVTKPYKVDDNEIRIGLSIGIALAPLNGTRPEQLLRNADFALYRAKADGRGIFRFFENSMDSELRERRMLENELRDAVGNEELVLHFQPLIDAKSRKTLGMESLVRWEHPIRGLLSPIEFVELAEQAHLISEIGYWILTKACQTAKQWPGDTFVAVNLSGQHFMHGDIVSEVAQVLKETGLPASRLELEITESLLINNSNEVVTKLDELKELGVSVAMDDFGTGYSSLSYLMSVPFDKLKIDKSFVDNVPHNDAGNKIVRMIATLARELELKVTAEGVETDDQAEFLEEIGCDMLQGYLFSKPMPEEMLPAYFLKATAKSVLRKTKKTSSPRKRKKKAA